MKNLKFIIPIILFAANITFAQNMIRISGTVTTENSQAVSFVNITIEELNRSAFSDSKGKFSFTDIPTGTYHISLKRSGFNTASITTSGGDDISVVLVQGLIETAVIDVTSSFSPIDINNSSFAVTEINARSVTRLRSSNLANTLKNIPGIDNVSTGNDLGKPVIRGLTSQSVLIVEDGVKQENQQWGDEHTPEISLYDISRIEILRGPASLIYGSDGIGGAINIQNNRAEFSEKKTGTTYGELDLGSFSNSRMGSGNLSLGYGLKNFGIKGSFGYRRSGNIRQPDGDLIVNIPDGANLFSQRTLTGGELSNSSTKEYEGNVLASFKGNFGSIDLKYSNFHREPRLHDEDPLATGSQKINTNNYLAKGNFSLNKNLSLEPTLSYETHSRIEYGSDEDLASDTRALNLELENIMSDVKLHHMLSDKIEGTAGLTFIHQKNRSLAEEKLIPNYNSNSIGGYILERYTDRLFSFSLGGRYDTKKLNVEETVFETDSLGNPSNVLQPQSLTFNSFSGSAGFVIKPTHDLNFFANVGRGWRAPSEFELFVDGVHEGTGRFERGLVTINGAYDPKNEESINLDLGVRYSSKYLSAEISAYRNTIDNFIYPAPTGETDKASGLPVFNIMQDKSSFTGYEYSIQVSPVKWMKFSAIGDLVETKNLATNDPLPLTPPVKNYLELKLQASNLGKNLYNPYFLFGVRIVSAQDKIDPLEAPTEGYTLLNASIGMDFVLANAVATIDLSGENLADTKYVSNLSRYRYIAMNPGRSIDLKLSVPFRLK